MRIRWTPSAAANLQKISDYLRKHRPQYRQPTLRKLYQKICALRDAPYVGRQGRMEGTRELCFYPFLILRCTGLRNTPSRFGEFFTLHKTAHSPLSGRSPSRNRRKSANGKKRSRITSELDLSGPSPPTRLFSAPAAATLFCALGVILFAKGTDAELRVIFPRCANRRADRTTKFSPLDRGLH